jgi:hypothetical protein
MDTICGQMDGELMATYLAIKLCLNTQSSYLQYSTVCFERRGPFMDELPLCTC